MSEEPLKLKEKFLFGISAIPDQLTYQVFQFLIFTYYFTVVRLPLVLIVSAYIIWGVWNAVNDPLVGALSERTKHKKKFGKRRFFIIIAIFPLALLMIFLFYVPFETASKIPEFIYFLVVIVLFELVYSMFNVNMNAIFPDQFPTEQKRASIQIFRNITFVIALILGSLIPALIISDLVPDSEASISRIKGEYLTMGVIVAVITLLAAIPFTFWGIKEREETVEDFKKRPSIFQSFKTTLKSKSFLKFTLANTMMWYCFTILPLVMPIYAEHVLGVSKGAMLVGLSLMLAFVVAAISMPIHRKIGLKLGIRNAMIINLSVWILILIPYFFMSGEECQSIFMITTAAVGFPIAGSMFYTDLLHSDVIDEDALKFGVRRGASFYGVMLFIQRSAVILVIITVAIMFGNIGWEQEYNPVPADPELVAFGLKSLMFIFPAIALTIAILLFKSYSLHGEKLKQVRQEIEKHPELKI
ncbi:MAG: MFS transporter [Candidatus Lokiarchaeota archaeon]|nr:MFS transporter [Candidatus Lokiarchaeota archaeon]MBD3337647.1 MFS transporter [Candidatus Lokiarchaeota archaeon]